MRKVIGIGETVLDIIFKDGQPFKAVAGGSTLNGMISLGRAGVPTAFVSEAGNDRIGEFIIHFLQENGVDASGINVYPSSKSHVSLAFLNDRNDAEYIFYKDHQHDRMEFGAFDVQPDDIIVFGSYFAINPAIRPQVVGFLEDASRKGAILYYDVNFRSSHRDEIVKVTPNLLENYELADIVRGSREDFEILYKVADADRVYQSEISFYCKRFIYTQGADPVVLRSNDGFRKEYPIEPATPLSTIGAGDNYNAGIIYGILKNNITREQIRNGLTESQWDEIMACARAFSAESCKQTDNYISKEFGNRMKQELNTNTHETNL